MTLDKVFFNISERMPSVVDPALRMRLSSRYLTLLNQWNKAPKVKGRRRITEEFAREVYSLFNQVKGGQVAYKYTPALGTINDGFYRVYSDAMGSIERLSQLAEAQNDIASKKRWKAEISDLTTRLNNYRRQVESSSTNANLSQIDAMSSQVSQYLASYLLPREVEWSNALGLTAPKFKSSGASGVVARFAYPDKWYVGHGQKTSLPDMGKRTRSGKRVPNTSYVTMPGMGGVWDDIQSFATGVWEGTKGEAQGNADKYYANFKSAFTRIKVIEDRQNAHGAAIVALRDTDPEKAKDYQQNLDSRKVLLANAKAQLKDVGTALTRTSFYSWDEPLNMVNTHLGGLSDTNRAIILLYSDDIDAINAALSDIEKQDDAFEREMSSEWSTATKAAVAGGSGLALLGVGALAYFALRGK